MAATPEQEIIELLSNPGVLLETLTELDGGPTRLEPYQWRYLNDMADFRIVNKSRQIGFSTIIAAEGFARALTSTKPYKCNYVSINQTEAADKIEIARNFYHSIPDVFGEGADPIKRVLWKDSEHEIAFGRPPRVASLISQPASSGIRGGRKDIYFDEFAHIRDAKKLFTAAMPAIIRGGGRFTIISTPLGQSGLFYDVCTDIASYPQYSRHSVPWWECSEMVKPEFFDEAIAMAPDMDTVARVAKYGTLKLQSLLDGLGGDIQSFQTEFEATFVDETEAYYPWELVIKGVNDDLPIWRHIPNGWQPEGDVSIGVDLAKMRDESVFTVVEHIKDDAHPKGMRQVVRLITTSQADYDKQADYLIELAIASHARRITIDETGPGAMFVERLKKSSVGTMVEGVTFTNAYKENWATRFKGALQGDVPSVSYPRIAQLLRQIHNIRRTKSEAGFYKFSGGSAAKADDYFWSLCLALFGKGRVAARISSL